MATIKSGIINLDTAYPECCSIDTEIHVADSLGTPIALPPTLDAKLATDWALESEADLLALFELMTGEPYRQAIRDNTYNSETDLSDFLVFTVYVPERCPDHFWHRDTFVVVEIGAGGDPRCSSYGPAKVYRLDDACLGECGFLDWSLGWWAEPIADRYDRSELECFNDRICTGYSSSPYHELEQLLYAPPIWCEPRQAYVGRFKGCDFPVLLLPQQPHYGG